MLELEKQFVYRIQAGDTINLLCEMFNTSKDQILRNNNGIPLYEGELVEIYVNNFKIHIVKPTETLFYIAEKYNVDIHDLKQNNKLQSEKLYIGQMLKIY